LDAIKSDKAMEALDSKPSEPTPVAPPTPFEVARMNLADVAAKLQLASKNLHMGVVELQNHQDTILPVQFRNAVYEVDETLSDLIKKLSPSMLVLKSPSQAV